jgi:hypothetical protein
MLLVERFNFAAILTPDVEGLKTLISLPPTTSIFLFFAKVSIYFIKIKNNNTELNPKQTGNVPIKSLGN